MGFPQINASQLTTLKDLANGLGAFSQAVPDPKKDLAANYEAAMEVVRDNEQLVILGLIKEITGECGEKLAEMFAMSDRYFRVFQITDIGQIMFEGVEKHSIQ